MIKILNKKNHQGYSLTELLVVMLILSMVTLACMAIIASALSAKKRSVEAIEEHVALRQAVLVVTRAIRKAPDEIGDIIGSLYIEEINDKSYLMSDDVAIAKDITSFDITKIEDDTRAKIYFESTSGRKVETAIYLRYETVPD